MLLQSYDNNAFVGAGINGMKQHRRACDCRDHWRIMGAGSGNKLQDGTRGRGEGGRDDQTLCKKSTMKIDHKNHKLQKTM